MKKTIRLTESDLHRVIKRAVYEATKGESGMTDKQKQRSRNANYIKDVNGSGDKYFHPNTYSDYEPSNVDRYERNAPFHGDDWFDDKVHMDRMKKHRSSQNHKDPDDFMESIVRESVKRVMNEVKFGGESLHGDNPTDWATMHNLRSIRSTDKALDNADATKDRIASERDFENAYGTWLPRNVVSGANTYQRVYDEHPQVFRDSNDKAKRIMRNLGRKPRTVFGRSYDGLSESSVRNIVRESIKRVINESYLYTKDINTDDLRINGHWTEDGYAEWEASVDNGWYTLRGTYDGHDCELEEIIEGHSGHSIQHNIDDDAIDWFNQNICDRVKSWLDKYAEDYSEWHSNMYGDE